MDKMCSVFTNGVKSWANKKNSNFKAGVRKTWKKWRWRKVTPGWFCWHCLQESPTSISEKVVSKGKLEGELPNPPIHLHSCVLQMNRLIADWGFLAQLSPPTGKDLRDRGTGIDSVLLAFIYLVLQV
ncbi:hypothetical protein GE061_000724 [Apolygus lucorum]|uniref:Uncharacterized protein n=1 Tax=Apolygus lucorum TaxID=248454 RepID=A0A6A4KL65_APOLU|nr:hypothetical protein GE061_000724 [Apolygus lucorum]